MQTCHYLGALERESANVIETFATWKTTLVNDLEVLTQLRGTDDMSQMRHVMKEQDIGLHCYQAEENLTNAELALLKKVLSLSELRWRAYKSKLRPGKHKLASLVSAFVKKREAAPGVAVHSIH